MDGINNPMKIQDIFEGRDAPLYHGTSLFLAAVILTENTISAKTYHEDTRLMGLGGIPSFNDADDHSVYGVSLTRDYQKGLDFGDVVFEINQRKLSQTNKIIPFDFWAANLKNPSLRGNNPHKSADGYEFEEFCVGDIKPATKYITTIYMRHNRYNSLKRFPENAASFKVLENDQRFKIVENNRKVRTPQSY